ncbi:MAG: TrmH family RNA methyltransferase [Candidatus Aenigmatarchaeota archaeon]
MEILLYKLKSYENLYEILKICKELDIKVHAILREKYENEYEKLKEKFGNYFNVYKTLEEFLEITNSTNKKFLILETFGNKLIFDIDLKDFDFIVLGAEDFGIPMNEIEKIKNKEVVKIPTKAIGSYNVVSSLIIFLSFVLC